MSKAMDISHLVFMDLLGNLVETTGSKVAKGKLMRIAMNTGAQVEKRDFATFDDFIAAVNNGDTPLAQLEGQAMHTGKGIFGLRQCPFSALLKSYNSFFAEEPGGFQEITAEFNLDSKMTRELKVGLGAGVGPFCIFHQPMRSTAGNNLTIEGKPIEIFQLACKSSSNEKAYADTLIDEFGCDRSDVEAVMDEHMCCYGIRWKN